MRGSAGIPIDPVRDLRLLPPGDTLYRIPGKATTTEGVDTTAPILPPII